MKKILLIISILAVVVSLALCVNAHPGKTDGAGGHTDRSTGEYHYHHGYSAHNHYDMDGDGNLDCPYNFKDKTDHSSGSESGSESSNSSQHYEDKESNKEQPKDPTQSPSKKNTKIDEDIMTLIWVIVVLAGSWVIWYFFFVKII